MYHIYIYTLFNLGLNIPNFDIFLKTSCPECCPITQYISNCSVCLLVGTDLDTLKSHNVSVDLNNIINYYLTPDF